MIFLKLFLAYQTLVPKGKDGAVEVSVKLKGYKEDVLKKNEVKNAVRTQNIIKSKTQWKDTFFVL